MLQNRSMVQKLLLSFGIVMGLLLMMLIASQYSLGLVSASALRIADQGLRQQQLDSPYDLRFGRPMTLGILFTHWETRLSPTLSKGCHASHPARTADSLLSQLLAYAILTLLRFG